MGKSLRQFVPKKDEEVTPDDLDHVTVREVRRLVESGEPLSEEVRKKLTELRANFLNKQFEPAATGENPGIDAFVALLQQQIHLVMTRFRSNPLIGNILLATDEGASDETKMDAYLQVKEITKARMVSVRQHLARHELRDMAKSRGTTVSKVAEENIIAAIPMAIEAVDELTIDDVAKIGWTIRKTVNDLATQALIGPSWRREERHDLFEEDRAELPGSDARIYGAMLKKGNKPPTPVEFWQVETKLHIEQLMKQAKLSPGEAQFMDLLRENGGDESGAARTMRIKPSTGRQFKKRAFDKVRKIKK